MLLQWIHWGSLKKNFTTSIATLSLGESGVSVAPPEACYRTAESHVLGRTVCVQMLRCPGPAIAGLASAISAHVTKESPAEKYIAQRMRGSKAN